MSVAAINVALSVLPTFDMKTSQPHFTNICDRSIAQHTLSLQSQKHNWPYLLAKSLSSFLTEKTLWFLLLWHIYHALHWSPALLAAAGEPLVGYNTTAAKATLLIGQRVCLSIWIPLPALRTEFTMHYIMQPIFRRQQPLQAVKTRPSDLWY